MVSDLADVGWWKRTETSRTTRVSLDPTPAQQRRQAIETQASALAAHTGRALELVLA